MILVTIPGSYYLSVADLSLSKPHVASVVDLSASTSQQLLAGYKTVHKALVRDNQQVQDSSPQLMSSVIMRKNHINTGDAHKCICYSWRAKCLIFFSFHLLYPSCTRISRNKVLYSDRLAEATISLLPISVRWCEIHTAVDSSPFRSLYLLYIY